tara:strand:+ start:167 stop:460 length:294 start_codon:yes stop_codon:yes gene_type:complete
MKLTKEAIVRIIQQEIEAVREEEDLEDTIANVQDEKAEAMLDVIGPLIDSVSELVIDKFEQGAKSSDLEGIATPEEVASLGAEALKQAIADKIEDMG